MPEEFVDQVQTVAYLLTVMLLHVSPRIDEGKTFDILVDWIVNGEGEDEARDAGAAIRATCEKRKPLN